MPILRIFSNFIACPLCSELIARGKSAFQAMQLGGAVNASILLMLAIPFILVTGLFFLLRPKK
jgi:hypothetical protein